MEDIIKVYLDGDVFELNYSESLTFGQPTKEEADKFFSNLITHEMSFEVYEGLNIKTGYKNGDIVTLDFDGEEFEMQAYLKKGDRYYFRTYEKD